MSQNLAAMLCLSDPDVCHCRVAFQVLPNIVAQPKPIVRWQYAAATVLFGLTLLSATQLGLLANVSKLPKVDLETDSRLCMFTCIIRLDVMLRVTQLWR